MSYSDRLAKLTLVLHYSVPPVLAIVLAYVMVIDKTFGLFKLIGSRLPSAVRNVLRIVYTVCDAGCVIIAAFWVWNDCGMYSAFFSSGFSKLGFEEEETCLPAVTIVALVSLCTLWTDRIVVAFFQLLPSGQLGFRSRTIKATVIACAFMALATNDPCAILLLAVHASNRPSGVANDSKLSSVLRFINGSVRVCAFGYGVVSLSGYVPGRISQRSSAVVIMGSLSSSV